MENKKNSFIIRGNNIIGAPSVGYTELTYDQYLQMKDNDEIDLNKQYLVTCDEQTGTLLSAEDIAYNDETVKSKIDELDNTKLDKGSIDDSTSDGMKTWSSSKIVEYVAENASPSYSGTVIPTKIASGATVTTDWDISSAGSNADYGRLLMLNSTNGTFLIYVKGNLGNTSTIPTPTVISSIANSQSATWSSSFELSISSGKLQIKNKSGAVASWRFV